MTDARRGPGTGRRDIWSVNEASESISGWRAKRRPRRVVVVERIRTLLDRYPEDEESVRTLVGRDARVEALCQEYSEVLALLRLLEHDIERLEKRRTLLEEELMTRIEGYQPM